MASETRPGLFANVLAIAGFVVVVIIIIWGLIHLSTLAGPWFSSLFSNNNATASLSVRAPESATSGDAFTLNWSGADASKGSYSFIYPCSTGVSFKTVGASGTASSIPCGAAFGLSGNSLSLIPLLAGTSTVNQTVTVVFIPAIGSGAAQAQGSATIAIAPGSPSQTTPASANTTKVSTAQTTRAGSGPGDLSVQMLSIAPDGSGNATVVFEIWNTGTGESGSYSFTVYLPTATSYTYYSPAQSSLAPGAHIVNTLHFTQAISGPVSVTVQGGSDSNKTNNYATGNLAMPYAQPQYYQQPTYVPPQAYPYYSY